MTTRELIAELAGIVCRCGDPKEPRRTFCRRCYYSLPRKLRARLYDLVGGGYERAYDEAVAFLRRRELDAREAGR